MRISDWSSDVCSSDLTADLIEGGVAGAINLRLNKPFNFKEPTVVVTARGNYGLQTEELNPQFGALATDRWDTGIGEIGALISASWSDADSLRINSNLTDRRNSGAGPLKTPGYFIPNILQNATHASNVKRPQINAAQIGRAPNHHTTGTNPWR